MLLDDEQTVAALIIKAEVQGGLVLEDIYELVPDLDENFEQIERIMAALEEAGVRLTDTADDDDDQDLSLFEEEEDEDEDAEEGQATDDSIALYLREMARVPLLTTAEEVSLAKRMERGERAVARLKIASATRTADSEARLRASIEDGRLAREHIIKANTRLVVSIAKKYMGRGVHFLDLIQEGNLGLMKAVEKFNYKLGFRFSTYATWALRYNFARAVGKPHDFVGLSSSEGEAPLDIADYRADPAANRAQLVQHRTLERMLDKLDDRERAIITRRYGLEAGEDERSLQEVAHEMGICKERVRQLQMRALEKLRVLAQRRHLEEPAPL